VWVQGDRAGSLLLRFLEGRTLNMQVRDAAGVREALRVAGVTAMPEENVRRLRDEARVAFAVIVLRFGLLIVAGQLLLAAALDLWRDWHIWAGMGMAAASGLLFGVLGLRASRRLRRRTARSAGPPKP
jgi:hypothetical protein